MFITVDGTPLYYEVSGTGPAIILVHGNGGDHEIFHETVTLLKADYTVYALDSRGHGKSLGAEKISYEQMAEDVASFVRILKLYRPLYCGFSDGGIVGLLAAIAYPGLFRGMVICGANAYPKGLKRRWLFLFSLLLMLNHDPKIAMMLREPQITGEKLEQISVPTLILSGERDMVHQSHTIYLAEKIPNSRLFILPGETHGSYIIHSRKLYYHMKKFLKELSHGEMVIIKKV